MGVLILVPDTSNKVIKLDDWKPGDRLTAVRLNQPVDALNTLTTGAGLPRQRKFTIRGKDVHKEAELRDIWFGFTRAATLIPNSIHINQSQPVFITLLDVVEGNWSVPGGSENWIKGFQMAGLIKQSQVNPDHVGYLTDAVNGSVLTATYAATPAELRDAHDMPEMAWGLST